MRNDIHPSRLLAGCFVLGLLLLPAAAHAQISGNPDVNTSKLANYQNECSIIKNPTNKLQLFASCNNATGGMFAARSTDLGVTWTLWDANGAIADGADGFPVACCDPTLTWDSFGNLYLGYLNSNASAVVILLSTDSGATFSTLASFPGSVDQPTIVSADT